MYSKLFRIIFMINLKDFNVKHELRLPLETERVLSIQIPSGNWTHFVSKIINYLIFFVLKLTFD